jgi:hypothetical protein
MLCHELAIELAFRSRALDAVPTCDGFRDRTGGRVRDFDLRSSTRRLDGTRNRDDATTGSTHTAGDCDGQRRQLGDFEGARSPQLALVANTGDIR